MEKHLSQLAVFSVEEWLDRMAPTVQGIREELLSKLAVVEHNIDNMIFEKLTKVFSWKYASDEYYNYLPYDKEIYKFKKGRILKNMTEGERFSKRTIHSFGFDKSEQLIIMQYPNVDNDIKLGTGTFLYDANPDKSINRYVTRWYPENNHPTSLGAISLFKPLNDNNWIYVGISSNKRNWSAKHYIYNESKRLDRIVACDERMFTCNASAAKPYSYDFVYNNNNEENPEKIMVGDVVWWKRKSKK